MWCVFHTIMYIASISAQGRVGGIAGDDTKCQTQGCCFSNKGGVRFLDKITSKRQATDAYWWIRYNMFSLCCSSVLVCAGGQLAFHSLKGNTRLPTLLIQPSHMAQWVHGLASQFAKMPYQRRTHAQFPRAPAPVIPRTLVPVQNEASQTITAQQEAIADLRASMAGMAACGPATLPPQVSLASAPEKCEVEIAPAAFKLWRRSIESWLLQCRWPPQEAVQNISRLHCVPALQRILDARFTLEKRSALTPATALDAISKLVLRSSTQVVQ